MSEYDLKKSEKIGQLYPVLVDAKGNVIDGFHRLETDPNWRTEKLSGIDTEEKLLLARCVANWHRRQISREEKEQWINGLARVYKKQGYKISVGSEHKNEIVEKIVNVTGLTPRTVRSYIHSEFLQEPREHLQELQMPRVPASQVIETIGNSRREGWGKRLVERHREEVEQELRPKIREELRQDAEFVREAIEKAPEVLPTLSEKTIERAKRAIEPLVKEMRGEIELVKEIDTGDIWLCPSCKKKFHLIHVEPKGTHRFEEVVE